LPQNQGGNSCYHFAMQTSSKTKSRHALEVAVALLPWLISMFTLYWLEYGEIWTTETAHRGKISVTILVVGMSLSFLLMSRFARRKQS
jgi:hypothetical protein